MKKIILTALAAALWGLPLAGSLSAQPILNRVEQLLRSQTAAQKPAAQGEPAEQGYLGVIADDRQEQGRGVRVLNVLPNGPAATSGLKNGDLITAINAQAIRTMGDMGAALRQLPPGTKLEFTVLRDGAEQKQQVTLGTKPASQPPLGKIREDMPDASAAAQPAPAGQGVKLGVRTLPVSEDTRQQNNLPNTNGAVVVSITVGSAASQAGIPLGAVITAVDDRAVNSPHELATAIRDAGEQIELTYVFRGQENRRRVTMAAPAASEPSSPVEASGRVVARPAPGEPAADEPALEIQSPADSRIAALEDQIRQLEERIQKLEAALKREQN